MCVKISKDVCNECVDKCHSLLINHYYYCTYEKHLSLLNSSLHQFLELYEADHLIVFQILIICSIINKHRNCFHFLYEDGWVFVVTKNIEILHNSVKVLPNKYFKNHIECIFDVDLYDSTIFEQVLLCDLQTRTMFSGTDGLKYEVFHKIDTKHWIYISKYNVCEMWQYSINVVKKHTILNHFVYLIQKYYDMSITCNTIIQTIMSWYILCLCNNNCSSINIFSYVNDNNNESYKFSLYLFEYSHYVDNQCIDKWREIIRNQIDVNTKKGLSSHKLCQLFDMVNNIF